MNSSTLFFVCKIAQIKLMFSMRLRNFESAKAMIPKQRVVSSNLITRSSLENRGFLRGNLFIFGQGTES